jgi:DNA-binding CsgD family transcriptional regulator
VAIRANAYFSPMVAVAWRDLQAIHRFLEDAYAITSESTGDDPNLRGGALPRPVLRGVEALISADLVESFEICRGYFGLPITTDRDEDVDDPPGLGTWGRRGVNPIRALAWSPAHGPLRLSGLMSRRRLEALPWHRYYLEPLGIRDQLKVWLWRSPDAAACVSLNRSDGTFGDRDVAVLSILQQHLAAMRESLMTPSAHAESQAEVSLTVREAQVLSWVARGRSNQEIAALLFISPATVRKHLEHAYAKLGVRSRVEAVAALRQLRQVRLPGPGA